VYIILLKFVSVTRFESTRMCSSLSSLHLSLTSLTRPLYNGSRPDLIVFVEMHEPDLVILCTLHFYFHSILRWVN